LRTFGYYALKLLWLALRKRFADKARSADDWKATMNQLAVMFGERFTSVTA
jgi:transposase-like protein